jgi:hypothetical protein
VAFFARNLITPAALCNLKVSRRQTIFIRYFPPAQRTGELTSTAKRHNHLERMMRTSCIQSSLLLTVALSVTAAGAFQSRAAGQPPGSWQTLFDGNSTEHWRGYKRDSFPDKIWKIEGGALKSIVGGQAVDLVTREKFDDFELELEWKIAPGGNSGIMYRVSEAFERPWFTGPELQLLDDFKHKDGPNPTTSAGSLYALLAPTNKVLKPAGEWNHTRLLANGNHVEHWLNGRKILEYELNSPALNELIAKSKFSDKPRFAQEKSGHIVLQHHRDEVWFRNIRIRNLAAPNTLTAEERAGGWKLLFDGKTTDGWRGIRQSGFPKRGWAVANGWLEKVCGEHGGDIVTVEQFEDFDLRWEWRIEARGNNGVKYLVNEARAGAVGHEYQMIDDSGVREAKGRTASFYEVLPPSDAAPNPVGEWNQSRILVQGKRVEHWLNGKKVLEYRLGSPELREAINDSKFNNAPGFGEKIKGPILLTDHRDPAWFRNIKIRELPKE